MATQKAIVVQEAGKPVVVVTDWPIALPGPTQIQIRVTVAGLNPHDRKGRDLGLLLDKLPEPLGNDVAGVVTAVGSNAHRFSVGDRVFSQAPLRGPGAKALQEYAVLEEDFSAVVPEGLSDDEAVTLPTNLVADIVALFGKAGLGIPAPWNKDVDKSDLKKSAILIVGGGTNCGRFATQLAKLAGFGTVVVVGGNEEQLKGFGATHVVDRHGGHDTVLQRVRDVVHDDLVYALDVYNGPDGQHLAINALSNSRRGQLARLVFRRSELNTSLLLPKQAGYELKNIMGESTHHRDVSVPFWQNISKLLEQGDIKPLDYKTEKGLDADKVNEVLDAYRDGKSIKQPHFRISE